ncbi:hypothetical protein ACVXG7_26285 [Enterobacter hormaechei]
MKMTDRPVHGDHPDYNPSPDNPEKDGRKPKMILAQRLNQAIKIQSNDQPPLRRRFNTHYGLSTRTAIHVILINVV